MKEGRLFICDRKDREGLVSIVLDDSKPTNPSIIGQLGFNRSTVLGSLKALSPRENQRAGWQGESV